MSESRTSFVRRTTHTGVSIMMKEDNNIDVDLGSGDAAAAAVDAGGVWFEGNDDLKDAAKGESSVDDADADAADARAISLKGENLYDQPKGETESERTMAGTYPADCYTFMALHGPFEKNLFFYFGFLVWLFQVRDDGHKNYGSLLYCASELMAAPVFSSAPLQP